MGDGWLLLALATLVAAVAATATTRAQRRMRQGVAFVGGLLVSVASLTGLAGLAMLMHFGPDSVRLIVREFWWTARTSDPLPQVHRPTPQLPRGGAGTQPGGPALVLDGIVTRVRDGDTIVVGNTPIRFSDVDCAEAGTPAGDRATAALRALASGRMVRCSLIGRQSYDREIGTCMLADGRDLGEVLVARGLCASRRH